MPPTKDELEQENAQLRERVAELEATNGEQLEPGTANPPREPQQPDFGLSAGEVDDLRNAGVTTSPFTGKVLNALDEGIEPATPQARKRAERERAERGSRTNRPAPNGGPPPAEGGDVGASVSTADTRKS